MHTTAPVPDPTMLMDRRLWRGRPAWAQNMKLRPALLPWPRGTQLTVRTTPLIWIGIDEFAVAARPETIRSVLGSCVGIGLFDTCSDWFAFNHFLDAESGSRVSEEMMVAIRGKGCRDFRAIIAGGARQTESRIDVGERNIAFAGEFLQRHRIPLLREDVGGSTGRTVDVTITDHGPVLVTQYHGERRDVAPVEAETPVSMSDAYKSSREAYETLLAISQRAASRRK